VRVNVGVAKRVPVTVGSGVRVSVTVAEAAGLAVAVRVTVVVRVRLGLAVDVAVRLGLAVAVADGGRDPVGVIVAVWVSEGVRVRDGVLVRVGERVAVSVAVGGGVTVAGRVAVAVGVELTRGVLVAVGRGGRPARTMICRRSPRTPLTSASWTVNVPSPVGIARMVSISTQNWIRASLLKKLLRWNSSSVQAETGLTAGTKLQARSLRMASIPGPRSKFGGSIEGTPETHTWWLPSPRVMFDWIWRSGRPSRTKTRVPTPAPFAPGTASTTSLNPRPVGRWYTGIPSASTVAGLIRWPSAAARPK
jgi:hypothetical protein